MNHAIKVFVWLGIGLSAVAADPTGQDQTTTPAEQYKALVKEQQLASSSGRVLTDEERLQFIGETFRRWNEIAKRFVALAEKYPDDPVAIDALTRAVWQVNSTPWPVELAGKDEARARALALLERDHIRSDKLGPLCERVSNGFSQEYETFLRAVRKENPHREVRAQACLALAHYLQVRASRLSLIREDPEQARQFADLFGADYLAKLQKEGPAEATREAEDLFEQARREYGDVTLERGTVAELAEGELFEIRHLTVGKEAPDMEGVDQDGRPMKLSDYRGKVVLIDFWSEY